MADILLAFICAILSFPLWIIGYLININYSSLAGYTPFIFVSGMEMGIVLLGSKLENKDEHL